MNASQHSPNESMSEKVMQQIAEEVPDLTQNHDEALDLSLGFAALGGLRHSAACNAAEKSDQRFDERNHRLHESRMKRLGLEGSEEPPEEDDGMTQQVLIRSPIIHNHYDGKKAADDSGSTAPQPRPADPARNPWLWPAVVGSSILFGTLGAGYLMSRKPLMPTPTPIRPDVDYDLRSTIKPGFGQPRKVE